MQQTYTIFKQHTKWLRMGLKCLLYPRVSWEVESHGEEVLAREEDSSPTQKLQCCLWERVG